MKKRSKIKSDELTNTSFSFYKTLNIIFVGLAILLLLCPLLIRINFIKGLFSVFLNPLGSFKGDYISVIGGIIGTFLAVLSAVSLNNSQLIKEANNKRNEEKTVISLKMKRLEIYIDQEIRRLWILFLWRVLDYSQETYDLKDTYPYEPYSIKNPHIMDDFISIEKYLSVESIETFYELYNFSDKINYYIDRYNQLRYDLVEIQSTHSFSNSMELHSNIRTNTGCDDLMKAIKFSMKNQSKLLFDEPNISSNFEIHRTVRQLERQLTADIEKFYDKYKESLNFPDTITKKANIFGSSSSYIDYIYKQLNGIEMLNTNFENNDIDEEFKKLYKAFQNIIAYETEHNEKIKQYEISYDNPTPSKPLLNLINEVKSKFIIYSEL